MSLDRAYRIGALVLALSSVFAGRIGIVLVPVIVVLAGLLAIRRRLHELARDERDWHRSFLVLLAIETTIELVTAWHLATPGCLVFVAGSIANALVIGANRGRMPMTGSSRNPCYVTIGPGTRLWWLGDVIADRMTPTSRWRLSPGDILELLGIWIIAAELWFTRL